MYVRLTKSQVVALPPVGDFAILAFFPRGVIGTAQFIEVKDGVRLVSLSIESSDALVSKQQAGDEDVVTGPEWDFDRMVEVPFDEVEHVTDQQYDLLVSQNLVHYTRRRK